MSKFCDLATINIKAGRGGNGSSHFRREKFVDKGGPDGGDGGRGGDIIFKANPNLNTLIDFKSKQKYEAENGGDGQKKLMHGKDGEDLVLAVPVGTQIYQKSNNALIADLRFPEQEERIARGGRGGLGNAHFKSSTNQTPNFSENGEKGEALELKLELKLVADVGIIGVPSAGKSTLISRITNSKPKIADYPFTTLIPNLGVVDMREFDSHEHFSFVVTDIPGLIEGAHLGKGLGHEFLRHVSRNHILVHLLDCTSPAPLKDFKTINNELAQFDHELAKKEQIVVFNKIDSVDKKTLEKLVKKFKKLYPEYGKTIHQISAVTGENLKLFVYHLAEQVKNHRAKIDLENPIEDEVIHLQPVKRKNYVEVIHVRKKFDARTRKYKNIWDVFSDRMEQVMGMTNLEDREGIERIYHFLTRLGIKSKLRQMGAQPGDRIRIGGVNGKELNMRQ